MVPVILLFFTITPLDQEDIIDIVATCSVHGVEEGKIYGSYMDVMGSFGHSQT